MNHAPECYVMPHVKNHDEKHDEKHDIMVFRFCFGVPDRAAAMIDDIMVFHGRYIMPVKLNHGSVNNGINRA